MKRAISLVLALVLALCLVACGTAEAPKSNIEKNDDSAALGTMQGGVYTNEYAGFKLTLDDKWVFSSEEELKELDSEDWADGAGVTDMIADNEETFSSIDISYLKLSMTERLAAATTTEEEIVDAMMEEKDELIAEYTQEGAQDVTMEKKTVTFLGQQRVAVLTTGSIEGISFYILQLQDYTKGSFGVLITLSSYITDSTQELLDMFEAI